MNVAKKILGMAIVLAGFSTGVVASARPAATPSTAMTLAHPTHHESRTVAACGQLPGTLAVQGNPPPSNMRYWCTQCIQGHEGQQHYHPDCPEGSRCSPNNGAPQCGGGTF